MVDFPNSSEEISSAWLSRVLGRAVSVLGVEQIGLNEGFTGGGLFRVTLNDGSVVAKLSPEDAKLRAMFARGNAREVQFYQMSAGQDLPVPDCPFGAFDPDTGASALVIEDMGNLRAVSFLAGCDTADIAAVVDTLAAVHGAFWEREAISDVPALALLDEFDFSQIWAAYPTVVAGLLPGVVLPDWFVALGDALAADAREIFTRNMAGPQTIVHRDAQLDNVLFGKGAVLLDWQFMGRGKGVHDLAFFLISSVQPDVRRACEDAMIVRYHAALGVAGYSLNDCRADYVFGAVWRLFITAMATTQLDNATPHKQAWRRADLERLIAFCEDHKLGAEMLQSLTDG